MPGTGLDAANKRCAAAGLLRGTGKGLAGTDGGRLMKCRGFGKHIAQCGKAAVERDEVEQIAMLAGGGIGPLAGGAGPTLRADQSHEQAAAGVLETSPTCQKRPWRWPLER